jgi:hypothetical protein
MEGRKPSYEELLALVDDLRRQKEQLQQRVAALEGGLAAARQELAAARQAAARQGRPFRRPEALQNAEREKQTTCWSSRGPSPTKLAVATACGAAKRPCTAAWRSLRPSPPIPGQSATCGPPSGSAKRAGETAPSAAYRRGDFSARSWSRPPSPAATSLPPWPLDYSQPRLKTVVRRTHTPNDPHGVGRDEYPKKKRAQTSSIVCPRNGLRLLVHVPVT